MIYRLLLLLLCLLTSICHAESPLVLRQFDVGEGNALLVTNGSNSILVDAGNPISTTSLIRTIKQLVPGTLSAVITTHPHQDHIGGIFQILNEIKIGKLYDNGQPVLDSGEPYRWYSDVFRIQADNKYEALHAGMVLGFGKLKLRILSPPPGPLDSDWNKNSLVIKVEFGQFCALLMGDALRSSEAALLKDQSASLHCPVIQIGHHGSKFASSPEFIAAVKAKNGIISINKNNIRGYPDSDTVSAWKAAGTSILTTYEWGTISCTATTDGHYAIKTEK